MNFTPEMIAAAKAADSPEALVARAAEQGITLSDSEALLYFRQLAPATGELTDDELDNVSGGCGGGGGKETPYYTHNGRTFTPGCEIWHRTMSCRDCSGSLCNPSDSRKLRGVFSYQHGGYKDWAVQCAYCNQFVYHGSRNPGEDGFY